MPRCVCAAHTFRMLHVRCAQGGVRAVEPEPHVPAERQTAAPEGGRLASRATPTGLEPATSAVTGRRANQLRYGALGKTFTAYPQRDSNPCYRRERAGS